MDTIPDCIFEHIINDYLLVDELLDFYGVNNYYRHKIKTIIKDKIRANNFILAHVNQLFTFNNIMEIDVQSILNDGRVKPILFVKRSAKVDFMRKNHQMFALYNGITHEKIKLLCKHAHDIHFDRILYKFFNIVLPKIVLRKCVCYYCHHNVITLNCYDHPDKLFEYQDYICIHKSHYLQVAICVGASNERYKQMLFMFKICDKTYAFYSSNYFIEDILKWSNIEYIYMELLNTIGNIDDLSQNDSYVSRNFNKLYLMENGFKEYINCESKYLEIGHLKYLIDRKISEEYNDEIEKITNEDIIMIISIVLYKILNH